MPAFRYLVRDGQPLRIRGAMAVHHTPVMDAPWSGPKATAAAPNDAAVLRHMHAWYAGENPDQKGSYKFPHHEPGTDTPANMGGVRNALSRLAGSDIPESDKPAVERHLRAHMEDGGMMKAQDASAIREGRSHAGIPGGRERAREFPGEIRARSVFRDGKEYYEVEGYASTFGQPYEMWDFFGPYEEDVDTSAFDTSLAASPDVAFLTNHRGVTMARSTNGSLEVYKDSGGLGAHAFLNAERQDVRDLVSAIEDKLITEMSFAFQLRDGSWNADMDKFTILEADINRGDVSAVNYGANPYTSITARASEWLADLERMPEPVVRAALARIEHRGGQADATVPAAPAVPAEAAPEPVQGRSTAIARHRLLVLSDR